MSDGTDVAAARGPATPWWDRFAGWNSSRLLFCTTLRGRALFGMLAAPPSAWQRKQISYSAVAGLTAVPLMLIPRTPICEPASAGVALPPGTDPAGGVEA